MLDAMENLAEEGRYDVAGHVACVRREGALLADLAGRAGLDTPVPSCPGWQVRDLLKHLGYVHRWAATYVGEGHLSWRDRLSEREVLSGGPVDADLPGWFREGHAGLVRTLEAADPGLACWAFLDAPTPLAFWARRQAHETAIHRVDAGLAGGGATTGAGAGFSPRFAADGIDEFVMGFLERDSRQGTWRGPLGTLGIHADEGAGQTAHWRVVSEPGRFAVARGSGPADCDVTGPAISLYLLLWNRASTDGLEVTGDPAVLAGFRDEMRVTFD